MWKKLENEQGYPYYVNETTNEKQWDHPKFSDITVQLFHYNHVRYSNYRLALKFRSLQRSLCMNNIPLKMIVGIFSQHKLGTNESNILLESYDLEAILNDVFFAAKKLYETAFDVDLAVELMQNFFYNVFDRERQKRIQVFTVKLLLGILSQWDLPELYKFLFLLCADHNNCMTRLRFRAILIKLTDLCLYIHEDVSFGQHLVSSTIESCFSKSPGLVGISEVTFANWLEKSPPLFGWILNLFRLRSTESVVHNKTCSTCKTTPLIGLRYTCMKCSNYTQCQNCFLTGTVNHSHKLTHCMREYYTDDNNRKEFNFLKKLWDMAICSRHFKSDYKDQSTTLASCNQVINIDQTDTASDKQSSPATIENIITQYETILHDLNSIVATLSNGKPYMRNCLEDQKKQISCQIEQLKNLKVYSLSKPAMEIQQSTPMVGVLKHCQQVMHKEIGVFSPISHNNDEAGSYSLKNISTWVKDQNAQTTQASVSECDVASVHELQNDLDNALYKLQQILSESFPLDGSV